MREINQEQIGGEDRIIGQSHMLLTLTIQQTIILVKSHPGKILRFHDKNYIFALKTIAA